MRSLWVILLGMLSTVTTIDACAGTGGSAGDPLKGIMGREGPGGITIYTPWFMVWPVPEISLSPVLAKTSEGARKLALDIVLSGSGEERPGRLVLTIDGEALDLDLGPGAPATVDTSGCVPTTTVTLTDQEGLVRRISKANDVRVAYGSPTGSLKATLTPADRENFRRITALHDMKVLPPPRPEAQALRDDGFKTAPLPDGVTGPRLIPASRAQPEYPERARRAGKSGDVYLIARVHKDGTVGAVRPVLISTGGCGFAEAAIKTVKKWKYTPGMKDGHPVEVDFEVIVNFSLQDRP